MKSASSPALAPAAETGMDHDGRLEHRLSLAADLLGWSPRRIEAFRDGLADGRKGVPDRERLGRHVPDHGFRESDLDDLQIDSLGYGDGVDLARAERAIPTAFEGEAALRQEAMYWRECAPADVDVDDADWTFDPDSLLAPFLRIMSHEEWKHWFVREHEDSLNSGRSGYGDLLLQDILHPVTYSEQDWLTEIWDGHHRVGACMVRGSSSIPAIKGLVREPAPSP